MAAIPSIFALGYSWSLCLFVCWGPLQHKGFSQTCACIPLPTLSTPTIPAQVRLASCPGERQLVRFVCRRGTWPVLAPLGPASNATHTSIVGLCSLKIFLFPSVGTVPGRAQRQTRRRCVGECWRLCLVSQRVQRGSCWNGVRAKAYVVCYSTAVLLVLLLFHWITLLLKQIMPAPRLLILIICCCDGGRWLMIFLTGLHDYSQRVSR